MDRIEPRIHDEIKDYKEKFYNFTLRQWIFGILILITTVPLYLVLSPKIGSNIAGWLVILVAIPIGFVGFIPIQGLNAERIMFFWKRNYINFAKPILYKTEEELLQEKNGKKKKTVVSNVSKKEQNLENTQSNFSLSQEEAQVLLKLAKQVVGKEEIEIYGSETKEDTPTKQEEA